MDKQFPTIQDVARLAKVSTATVSRTLSHPSRVSEDTRRRVLDAVEATGYSVNQTARNLRRQKTGSIVVVLPNLGNPFFSRILAGIESRLAEHGYNVLVADTKHPNPQGERLLHYLNSNRADGIIVLDGSLPIEFFTQDRRNAPPIVACCEWFEGVDLPSIRFDNAGGAAMAVRYLAERGHRKIAHLLGPNDNVLTHERRAGFHAELAIRGLEIRPEWMFGGDFTLPSGVAAARRWIEMEDRPTALTTSSDVMACGFISELHRHGWMVPRDISVIGFDDIEIAEIFIPALTTVRQPRIEIGESAADALLDILGRSGDAEIRPSMRLWPAQLIERESVRSI